MPEISYVMTYFNNPDMMKVHLATWHTFSKAAKDAIHFIVVDDCSTPPLEIPFAKLNLSVLRIHDDITWNLAGARNLGAHHCKTDWFLMTDTDMLLTADNAELLLALDRSDPNTIWNMNHIGHVDRKSKLGNNANQVFLNRELFWKCWGYSEDFAGSYGGQEGHLRSKLFREGGVRTLDHDVLMHHFGEDKTSLVIPDAKSSVSEMQTEKGLERARQISSRLYNNTPGYDDMKRKRWDKNVLRFKWDVVKEFTF
jgi:glycosyltransferase involved in cell wall biosynthesis